MQVGQKSRAHTHTWEFSSPGFPRLGVRWANSYPDQGSLGMRLEVTSWSSRRPMLLVYHNLPTSLQQLPIILLIGVSMLFMSLLLPSSESTLYSALLAVQSPTVLYRVSTHPSLLVILVGFLHTSQMVSPCKRPPPNFWPVNYYKCSWVLT